MHKLHRSTDTRQLAKFGTRVVLSVDVTYNLGTFQEERNGPKFLRKILIEVCGPVCINYTDQQIQDLAKLCTRVVLSVDVTYNLGTFQEEERDGPKFLRKILIDQVCGPVCINYTDQQIQDLAKFCTRDVLSVDVTYNLGTFLCDKYGIPSQGILINLALDIVNQLMYYSSIDTDCTGS